MEYIATGKHIPVEQALQFGMINRLVPDGQHLEAAIELATTITQNAPIAVRESLNKELIDLMHKASYKVFQTADAKEGPLAFVEKRKPQWKGR